jgi:hypothetical protein
MLHQLASSVSLFLIAVDVLKVSNTPLIHQAIGQRHSATSASDQEEE